MGEDVKTPGLDLPPTQVVALGYSIVGALSDNAQITFHHAIAEDESDASVNRKIDRLMGIIDRQRAKYEAPAIRKELADLEDQLSQSAEDIANSERNFVKAQADLDVQIQEMQSKFKSTNTEALERHKRSGRGGSYTPTGATKMALTNIQAGIDEAAKAKHRNEEEKQAFLSNIGISNQRRKDRIAILQGKLAEIDKIVG